MDKALIWNLLLPLVLWVLSLVVAVILARRHYDKKDPRLCYLTDRKIQRTKDVPGDVSVLYKGEAVDRVSSTLVWLWNAGRKPIRREDLRDGEGLSLKLVGGKDEFKILDVEVRKTSRTAIQAKVQQTGPASAEVAFNFLDANDGLVIEVVHTGDHDARAVLTGTILEAPNGVTDLGALDALSGVSGSQRMNLNRRGRSFARKVVLTVVSVCVLGGLLIWGFSSPQEDIDTSSSLLRTHLKPYVKAVELDAAVSEIAKNQRWDSTTTWLPYVVIPILCLAWLGVVGWLWSGPYPFPESLRLTTRTDSQKTPESGSATVPEKKGA